MDRRWSGAIVVAAVLLAAIAVPNLASRRLAGVAVPGPIAGLPSVGDCVLVIDHSLDLFDGSSFGGDDRSGRQITFPSATTGSCTGPVVGEVVSVDRWAQPPRRIDRDAYFSATSSCLVDAVGYTGSIAPVVDGLPGQPDILWQPAINLGYVTIGPDLAQRAAGQRWTACVIGSQDQRPYPGRLHDVLTNGWLPPGFGSCLTAPDASLEFVPCSRPHPAEVLGSTTVAPTPTTGRNLQQACETFAGRAMRNDDPTRQGELTIQVVDHGRPTDVVEPTDAQVRTQFVTCTATAAAGRALTGSLIGIGDHPLPTG